MTATMTKPTGFRDFEQIAAVMEARRSANSLLINEMLEVRKRYHADYIIPLPDMDDQPALPPLTPALVANAIDNPALTAAQVLPAVFCPPTDFRKPRFRDYARKREHAIKATWFSSKLSLSLYRMFRHMSGYATATALVRPNYGAGFPTIEVRDPLTAYPEPKATEDLSRVRDCGFIHSRSARWVCQTFPHADRRYGGPVDPSAADHQLWDIVEWWDEEQTVWGLLGPQEPYRRGEVLGHSSALELKWFPNVVGHCPVITMPRITLDRMATQVAHNVGIIDFMGRLLMLDMIAAERNVFPDRFMVGEKNEMPRIVSNNGRWADGRTGEINIVEGIRTMGELRAGPDPMTQQAADRLERNFKVSAGVSNLAMGENTSNLRTGRAIAEINGVAIDPKVMELHRIAEFGLSELNESILATFEACWPEDTITLFAGFQGNRSVDELEPAKHIDGEHRNAVSYTIAGADVQQTTIALGQLFGVDAISLETLREQHPYITDPELEKRLVEMERIERAIFDSVLQRASGGELPITYLARIAKELMNGVPIAEAVEKADQALREEQATPPNSPDEAGGMAVPPEAMPGLEVGTPAGAEMAALGAGPTPVDPNAATVGPTPNQVGLDQLLGAMRGGGMPV